MLDSTKYCKLLEVVEGKDGSSQMSVAESGLLSILYKTFVRVEGSQEALQINVLRDTGATQSLILDNVLPFSNQTSTGATAGSRDGCY